MGNYSKLLTILPIAFGLIFIGYDYLEFNAELEINQHHIDLIETIIGGTVIGGTVNAGWKRFTSYKEKALAKPA